MTIKTEQIVRNFPNRDRLSVLVAVIMLAFALANFIRIPVWEIAVDLPGFYLPFQISMQVVVLGIVAGLTAAGADWLFHDHPAISGPSAVNYWILPSLTSFAIGLLLMQVPFNSLWWLGLFIGGGILSLVLVGEYISIDSEDIRQPLAAAILISVSFALFLILIIGLHLSNLRLFFLGPSVFISSWLVSLRSLHLRLHGEWVIYESAIIALIVAQIGAGLTYWPLSPISYGLILLGPAYALNSLFVGLIEERPFQKIYLEPLVVLLATLGTAFLIR